jgi:hypothetical protein
VLAVDLFELLGRGLGILLGVQKVEAFVVELERPAMDRMNPVPDARFNRFPLIAPSPPIIPVPPSK